MGINYQDCLVGDEKSAKEKTAMCIEEKHLAGRVCHAAGSKRGGWLQPSAIRKDGTALIGEGQFKEEERELEDRFNIDKPHCFLRLIPKIRDL